MITIPNAQLNLLDTTPKGSEELSQWFTPKALALRLVRWAGICAGDSVLEPSCGDGAFVSALLEIGCTGIVANDIDPVMLERVAAPGVIRTHHPMDFLDPNFPVEPWDWVVQNPPYEHGQDRDHLAKGLTLAPKMLALIRTAALHGIESHARIWSEYRVRKIGIISARPSFCLGGDPTGSPKSDISAVVFDKSHKGPTTVGWLR